ncbi:hypothetical protein L208DRAFT_1544717, partial [Tricholoma matsutake]
MTSSMLVLPSCLPRCLASCTKPFPWFYLQLNTTEVILYNKVSDISHKYNKKKQLQRINHLSTEP